MKTTHKTTGTCAREITIEIDGDIIQGVSFAGGCKGNAQGVAALVTGMNVSDIIGRLKGIQCRNNTSCPDQLAVALEALQLKQAS